MMGTKLFFLANLYSRCPQHKTPFILREEEMKYRLVKIVKQLISSRN